MAKHVLDALRDECRKCDLSAEAIVAVPVKDCPGRELVTDAKGFPVPTGTVEPVIAGWVNPA